MRWVRNGRNFNKVGKTAAVNLSRWKNWGNIGEETGGVRVHEREDEERWETVECVQIDCYNEKRKEGRDGQTTKEVKEEDVEEWGVQEKGCDVEEEADGKEGEGGGAVKWHSWQMTSPVSQSPLLSTMICHLHFWHFSSHYQITLTEWYFLILPALEHAKNNGLHMLCTLFLCFPTSLFIFPSSAVRKYPVIFNNDYVASQIYCR